MSQALKCKKWETIISSKELGYFTPDKDSTADQLIFNRTVTLKDSFKID